MSRIVVVDQRYLDTLRRSFGEVCSVLRRNTYQPVQDKINHYISKGGQLLESSGRFLGDRIPVPEEVYHFTNSSKVERILDEGILISTDPKVERMWNGREQGIVPGVYIARHPTYENGFRGYDKRIVIRTNEIDVDRLIWNEDDVVHT